MAEGNHPKEPIEDHLFLQSKSREELIEDHLDLTRGLTHKQQKRANKLLYKACKDGDTDEVIAMIKEGGRVDYTGEWATPLGIASFKGHVPIVKKLVMDYHAKIDLRDEYERTPFLMACWGGNMEIVRFLHERGANLKAVDKWKAYSIHYGCSCQNTEVVQFLLRVQEGFTLKDLTDLVTQDGNTVLHYACLNGRLEVTKWLTDQGLSLATENKLEETCIFSACRNDNIELIEFLISKGLSLKTLNKNGETCIFNTCYTGDLELVKWLSKQGVPLDTENNEGSTCIFNACYGGHLELIKWLKESKGLKLDTNNKNKVTPMDQLRTHKLDGKTLQKKKEECQKYFKPNSMPTLAVDENGGPSKMVCVANRLVNAYAGMLLTPHD